MLVISLSRVVQFSLLLLTLRLSTEYLTPEEIGIISLTTSTIGLFALFLINPIGMYINRRLHDWIGRRMVFEYLKIYWVYLVLVNLIAACTLYLLNANDIWKPNINITLFILIVCGNLTFATINQLYMSMINMMGHMGWFATLTVATVGVSLVAAVLFVNLISPNAQFWLFGLLIGHFVIGGLGWYVFSHRISYIEMNDVAPIRLKISNINSVLTYAWPVAIAVTLGWMQNQGYRYVMEYKISLIDLGIFVAGFGISAGLMSGIETILSNYFQPIFYSKINQNKDDDIKKAWVEYVECMLPPLWLSTVAIIAVAPVLTEILLGKNFSESGIFIVWGALSEFGRVATAAVGMASHAKMKTIHLVTPNLVGALFTLILLVPMIDNFGAIGVGVTLVIASCLSFTAGTLITKRYLGMMPPLDIVFKSFIYSVGLAIVFFFVTSVVDHKESALGGIVLLMIIGLFYMLFMYFILGEKLNSKMNFGGILKKTV